MSSLGKCNCRRATVRELEGFLKEKAAQNDIYHLLSAFFYEKEGNDEKALKMYGVALKKNPDSAVLLYHKANLESYSLMLKDAEKSLKTALTKNPSSVYKARILNLLGKVYLRDGDQKKAIETWHTLAAANPDDVDLQEDIIDLEFNEGLFDEAVKDCKALLLKTTDKYRSVMLSLRLGDIYQNSDKNNEALELYRGLLAKVGSKSWLEKDILDQMERIHRMDDNMTGLQKDYAQLAELYSKRPEVLKRYAFVLQENGESAAAMQSFINLIKVTPGDRGIRDEYITLLVQVEKYDEAVKQVEDLIRLNKTDVELFLILSGVHYKSGDTEKAIKSVNSYLDKSSKIELDYMRCARLLSGYDETDAAMNIYRDMVKAFPESLSARDAAASYLYRQDAEEEALKMVLETSNAAGVEHIVRIAKMLMGWGEGEKAYALLKKHESEHEDDLSYITELYRSAAMLDKKSDALKYAIKRLDKVKRVSEFEQAIADGVAAVRLSDDSPSFIEKLKASKNKTSSRIALLAELLEKDGDGTAADLLLDDALKVKPGSIILNVEKTRIAQQRGDWQAAMKITENLLRYQPNKRSFLVRRIVDYAVKAEDYDASLKWIVEWKKVAPGSMTPYLKEAQVHVKKDELNEAIKVLRKAYLKFPDEREVAESLASLFVQNDSAEDAARIYWGLLEKSEDLSGRLKYVRELYRVADTKGKTGQLVRHFKTRMETNKKSIFPVIALASIYRDMGNYELRREYMMKASSIKSEDVSLLLEIAVLEEREGDYKRAESTLKKAVGLDKTKRSKEKFARHLLMYGDEDKGYDLIVEMAGGVNMDPAGVEGLVDALIANGNYERALELLEQVMALNAQDYRLGYLRGILLEELDRLDEAVNVYMEILSIKKELPRVTVNLSSTTPNRQQQQYNRRKWYGDFFPAQTDDLMNYFSYSYNAYTYRQNRGGRSHYSGYSSYSASARTIVQFPRSVDQVSSFVLPHLAAISADYDDEKKKKLVQRIEGYGVLYPDIKMNAGSRGRQIPILWDEALEKYPNDDVVLCMWLLNNNPGGVSEENDKRYKEVIAHFKKKGNKQVALYACLAATRWCVNPEEMAKDALALFKEIEKPSAMIMSSLVAMTHMGGEFSEETLKAVDDTVLELYETLDADDNVLRTITPYAIGVSVKNGKYNKFVEIINKQVDQYQAGLHKKTNSSYNRYRYGNLYSRGRGNLSSGLLFPSDLSAKIPREVIRYFQRKNNNNMVYYGAQSVVVDKEKLWEHVDEIKHPALKFLLADLMDKNDEARKIIDSLTAAEGKPDLDYLMLAAAWKGQKREYKEAVKILSLARHMPMDQRKRQMIDSAIVRWVLDSGAAKDSDVFKMGADAALRLRRYPMVGNQLGFQLVDILNDFGLSKEANKINKKLTSAKQSSYSRSRYSSRRMPMQMSRSITEELRKLYADGKNEKACQKAVRSFRQQAKRSLATAGGFSRSSYSSGSSLRQLIDIVVKHGSPDEFLKAIKPPENSKSVAKFSEYVVALELMDKKDEVRAVYDKILSIKPSDMGVNLRMAMLYVESDVDRAMKHLEAAANRSYMVGDVFVQLCGRDIAKAIEYTPLAVKLTELLKDKKSLPMHWLYNYTQIMENSYYKDKLRLDSMFYQNNNRYNKESKSQESKVLDEKRTKAYTSLCDILMEDPQYQATVFSRKLMLLRKQKKPVEAMVKQAEIIVMSKKSMRIRNYSMGNARINGMEVPFEGPSLFLIKHCYENGKEVEVDRLIKEMGEKRFVFREKYFKGLKTLYDAPPETFLEDAKSFVKNQRRSGSYHGSSLNMVLSAWKIAPKKPSLSPLILEYYKKNKRSSQIGGVGYAFLISWTRELAQGGGDDAVVEFLDKLRDEMIGDILKKEKLDRMQRNDVDYRRFSQYAELLGQLVQNKDSAGGVFRHISGTPLLFDHKDLLSQFSYRMNNVCRDWDLLKKAPVMKDWEEFRALSFGTSRGSLLYEAYQALRSAKRSSSNKKLYDSFKAVQPRTFGMGLLDAMLGAESSSGRSRRTSRSSSAQAMNIYEYLGLYLEKIKAADEKRQIDLFKALDYYSKAYGRTSQVLAFEGKAREVYDLKEKVMQKQAVSDFEKLKDSRSIQDVHSYIEKAGNVISVLLKTDPEKAEGLYTNVLKKARSYSRGQYSRSSRSNYRQSSNSERLLASIGKRATTFGELAFVCEMAQKPDAKDVSSYNTVVRIFDTVIRSDYEKNIKIELKASSTNNLPDNSLEKLMPNQQKQIRDRVAKMKEGRSYTMTVSKDDQGRQYELYFKKKGDNPAIIWMRRVGSLGKNASGEYIRVAAFAKTLDNMVDKFGKVYPVFLRDSLSSRVYNSFGKEEREAMKAWLSEKDEPTYREALGQLLFDAYSKDTKKAPPAELIDIYNDLMMDANLNAAWRLRFFSMMASNRGWDSIIKESVDGVLSAYADLDDDLLGSFQYSVPKYVSMLGDKEPTDQLKKAVRKFYLQWRRKYTSGNVRRPVTQEREFGAALSLFEVNLKFGNLEDAEAMLTMNVIPLPRYPSLYAVLVRNGKEDKAVKLINASWKDMLVFQSYGNAYTITKSDHEGIEKILPKLASDDMRIFTKILFARIPVTKPRSSYNYLSLDKGILINAAKEYKAHTFTSSDIKKQCQQLILMPSTFGTLKDDVLEWGATARIGDCFSSSSSSSRAIFDQYIRHLIDNGDVNKVAEKCVEMNKRKTSSNKYNIDNSLRTYASSLGYYSFKLTDKENKPAGMPELVKDSAKYIESVDKILKAQKTLSSEHNKLFLFAMALHYSHETQEKADEWVASFEKTGKIKEKYLKYMKMRCHEVGIVFRKIIVSYPEEKRAEMCNAFEIFCTSKATAPYMKDRNDKNVAAEGKKLRDNCGVKEEPKPEPVEVSAE